MNYQLSNIRYQILLKGLLMLIVVIFSGILVTISVSDAKWSGVDQTVIEKYAEEHGRPGKDPVINTDQGDLLLFMFLIGGLVGGFAAGYYWRMLTENSPQNRKQRAEKSGKKQEKKIVSV